MKKSDCTFKPELVSGPIGMFHCPECGEMQLAGMGHTGIMEEKDYQEMMRCLDEKHKNISKEELIEMENGDWF